MAKSILEAGLMVSSIAFILWMACFAFPQTIRDNEIRDARRATRVQSGECVHTGYAGRGEEKVYNCRGWILRWSEL